VNTPRSFIAIAVMSVLGWSACRSSPAPEVLFSEAEQLRGRYRKDASQEAIDKYRQAADAWDQQGQKLESARAWQRIGTTYWQLGRLNESYLAYQTALSRAEASPDRLLESAIRSHVGIAQSYAAGHTDVLDEAREQCARAQALARQAQGDREGAKALICFGEVTYFDQDAAAALDFFQQAGRLSAALGDAAGEAEAQLQLGHVYSDLGSMEQLNQAEQCLKRAQQLWRDLGDTREQAVAIVALGRVEMRRGHYQAALNRFQQGLTLLEPMGDAVWEGSGLAGIGRVYLDMGETAAAVKHWERALQLFETAGLKIFAVDTLMSLGATYLASSDHGLALSRFERALSLAEEQGVVRWKAWALRSIGVVYLVRHQPREALAFLNRASEARREVDDARLDQRLSADLGEAYDLSHRRDLAIKNFDHALRLSRTSGDRVTEARALFGLAKTSLASNELEHARARIERALSVAESLRTGVENRDLRASYVASIYGYYELQVEVLTRLHRVHPAAGFAARAFEASERARARSLLESLADSGVNLRAGVDPELLRREQEAKLAIDHWAARSRGASEDRARKTDTQRFASEYRDLEERYNQIQAEIRSRSPQYAALARPQPLALREIQTEVLDRDTVLLEYALGEERSYLWIVSQAAHVLQELPPRAAIEAAAQRIYERLVARADDEYWREAARLSDILLAPVATHIAGKRLLVVADGMLQYVPFAALPAPRRAGPPVPLLVEHEIVNLPSASVLAVLRRETMRRVAAAKAVAVFADPIFEADDPRLRGRGQSGAPVKVARLAATRQEARAILDAAPPGMALERIGFEASRAAALEPGLAQYEIVHFATHGIVDNENPGLSGLVLSLYDEKGQAQDGFLRLHDIYNLRLPAELIVLSACSTALGKQLRGEGLTGMVRGFFYAGAERVVASLWKVDDDATADLMRRFYTGMLRAKRSPAGALREAQLELWRQDRWRAPFYWAAFSLQGEWR
jgi:CHAT domain-containing protein/predicted negative regulator of RcsB-dependent stress response